MRPLRHSLKSLLGLLVEHSLLLCFFILVFAFCIGGFYATFTFNLVCSDGGVSIEKFGGNMCLHMQLHSPGSVVVGQLGDMSTAVGLGCGFWVSGSSSRVEGGIQTLP